MTTEWKSTKTGKPLGLNSAATYVGAIMGFYRSNGYQILFTEKFRDLFPSEE
ncbi:MAG: hypothetical protein ACETV1_07750 [Candidatus Bathyarchaeia archaeon]